MDSGLIHFKRQFFMKIKDTFNTVFRNSIVIFILLACTVPANSMDKIKLSETATDPKYRVITDMVKRKVKSTSLYFFIFHYLR